MRDYLRKLANPKSKERAQFNYVGGWVFFGLLFLMFATWGVYAWVEQ